MLDPPQTLNQPAVAAAVTTESLCGGDNVGCRCLPKELRWSAAITSDKACLAAGGNLLSLRLTLTWLGSPPALGGGRAEAEAGGGGGGGISALLALPAGTGRPETKGEGSHLC